MRTFPPSFPCTFLFLFETSTRLQLDVIETRAMCLISTRFLLYYFRSTFSLSIRHSFLDFCWTMSDLSIRSSIRNDWNSIALHIHNYCVPFFGRKCLTSSKPAITELPGDWKETWEGDWNETWAMSHLSIYIELLKRLIMNDVSSNYTKWL